MLSKIDYKMLAAFLLGTLVGCSVDVMIERLWML